MFSNFIITLATTSKDFQSAVEPIVDLINMIVTPAITLVGALGVIWCIILGVKLAKAEEPQEREKAKNALKNAIVGYVLIFVLIVVLKLSINPLTNWMEESTKKKTAANTSSQEVEPTEEVQFAGVSVDFGSLEEA